MKNSGWRIFAITVLAAVIFYMLFGCSTRKTTAQIPGCLDASVYVPRECYTQQVENGILVRCPNSANTYTCIKKGPK